MGHFKMADLVHRFRKTNPDISFEMTINDSKTTEKLFSPTAPNGLIRITAIHCSDRITVITGFFIK